MKKFTFFIPTYKKKHQLLPCLRKNLRTYLLHFNLNVLYDSLIYIALIIYDEMKRVSFTLKN